MNAKTTPATISAAQAERLDLMRAEAADAYGILRKLREEMERGELLDQKTRETTRETLRRWFGDVEGTEGRARSLLARCCECLGERP